jgi:peptidoglycan/LPS O-acetylase OafA/YrhL
MHRISIDGLRAVAVLSVIINHFDKALLPNGYLGVDIFYVISGFVITQSLASRQNRSFSGYIFEFYSRRIKRLFPALFLCVAVTCLLIFLFIPPGSLSESSIRTGIAALFGLSNLYLFKRATDYFGSSAELNPFTHTWSLGVEEQFYFLFPVLLWVTGLPLIKKKNFIYFSFLIGTTAVISFILYIWLSSRSSIAAFYLMPMRFWEIAMGAIAFSVVMKFQNAGNINTPKFVHFVTLTILLILIVVLFLPQPPYQAVITFAVAMLTSILIVGVHPASIAYRLLTLKPLVFIGVISYSLYLWHWSVLAISRSTVGVSALTVPFQFGAIFLLAFLSYQLIEQPLRRSEWRVLRITGSLRLGEIEYAVTLALSLAVVILFIVSPLHKNGYFYAGIPASLIKKGVITLKEEQIFGNFLWTANECVLSSNSEVGKAISLENCTFGDYRTAGRRFLVIGNSFSAAEIEMYKVLVEEKRGSVTITSSWGASPVPEIENRTEWDKANNYYWNSVIPKLIKKLSAGDVLLMINDGAGFSAKINDEESKQKINDLRNGLARISEEMLKRGIYVVYQSSNPFMRESNCTPDSAKPQWWNFGGDPPCNYYTREDSLKRRRMYHETLLKLQSTFENFAVLDLFDLFCPYGLCKFYNSDGVFLYRDEWSHPSVEASIFAKPILLETVDKLIRKLNQGS